MRAIHNILEEESTNLQTIHLYGEGIFYKAYEHSAFAFVKYVRAFKVKKRYIKSSNSYIVSLGFPKKSFATLFPHMNGCDLNDEIRIPHDQIIDNDEYMQWKEKIPLGTAVTRKENLASGECENNTACINKSSFIHAKDVVEQIISFSIESHTPLECMQFIAEIKKQIFT